MQAAATKQLMSDTIKKQSDEKKKILELVSLQKSKIETLEGQLQRSQQSNTNLRDPLGIVKEGANVQQLSVELANYKNLYN